MHDRSSTRMGGLTATTIRVCLSIDCQSVGQIPVVTTTYYYRPMAAQCVRVCVRAIYLGLTCRDRASNTVQGWMT